MPHSTNSIKNSLKIVWPIVLVGGAMGLILSWLVLSGDQQGRVNLFYLLLVYLLIPLLSIVASLVSLLFGKGINLARLITSIPMWSFHTKNLIRKIHQLNLDKYWFLLQSQAAAIAFSLASLITFFTLLLATDLNFVWRSTILEPNDILPLLETVAWPWTFWTAAQPDLLLLEMTQDSRISVINSDFSGYGAWWKFIFATQLCYSLMLRLILIVGTRWWIKRSMNSDIEQTLQRQINQHNPLEKEDYESSPVVNNVPEPIVINNWDGISLETLELLAHLDLSDSNILINGWQGTAEQQKDCEQWKGDQLVIVKAWEGPLGELEDFLQTGRGYLLPLDWDDSGLVKPELQHFHEWQRLINRLPNWQLYLPGELVPE